MKERVLKELKTQYDEKFKDDSVFEDFFKAYVLDAIKDEDLLKELNKKARNLSQMSISDYLESGAIIIRAIKVSVLLELSKDYAEFKRLNKKIAQDKQAIYDIEFEKLLKAITKVEIK
ncbi:hypothetical protein HZP71_18020 [Elizabethkingia anophelis]|nr:hypothetical protein [Elizabethkingia anophelis]